MTTPAQLPPPSRKRRITAAALCPLLGSTPLIALDAIGQPELTPISPHALWAYVGAPIFVMYAMAIPAIPAFWLLAMWSNASDRAWVSVPLLAAIFTLTSAVTIGSFEPAGLGFFFATLGLPIAVAYGLLTRASWRIGGTPLR